MKVKFLMMAVAVFLLVSATVQAQTITKSQGTAKPQTSQKSMIDTLSPDSIEALAYEGNAEACFAMGQIVMKQAQNQKNDELGFSLTQEKACKWYRTAANYGNAEAIKWCSDFYFQKSRGYDPNRDGMNVYGTGFEDYKIECLYYAARFGKNKQAMYEYAKVKEFHKDHISGKPREFF